MKSEYKLVVGRSVGLGGVREYSLLFKSKSDSAALKRVNSIIRAERRAHKTSDPSDIYPKLLWRYDWDNHSFTVKDFME